MASAPRPQPMKYHPHPILFGMKTLAGNATLAKGVELGPNDTLIVPPTPLSPNGFTERLLQNICGVVTQQAQDDGPTPLSPGDVMFVLKTVDGREALLAQNAGGENVGDSIDVTTLTSPVLNASQDLGYFVRVNAADVKVDIYAPYMDLRDAEATFVDVETVYPEKTLVFSHNEFGRIQAPGCLGLGGGVFQVQNFDEIDHIVRYFVSDGTNEIEITNVIGGSAGNAPAEKISNCSLSITFPVLPAGWAFYATLDESVQDVIPRLVFTTQASNAAARTDQAGAF